MTALTSRFLGMLGAVMRTLLWIASILTLLAYLATALSQADPQRSQATSVIPNDSPSEVAADVEPPPVAGQGSAGPDRMNAGLDRDSATEVLFWDGVNGQWSPPSSEMPGATSYSDGDVVPSLLRVDSLTPGTVYQIWLDYSGCDSPNRSVVDYLGTGPHGDAVPDLVTSGPGRSLPDARLPIPAGTSATEAPGVFDLWGATFLAGPLGPFPSPLCPEKKLIILRLTARSDTIYLLWGSHIGGRGQESGLISQGHKPASAEDGIWQLMLPSVTAIVRPEP